MKLCKRLGQTGLLLAAVGGMTVLGCDSDSDEPQTETHELSGVWEVTEFRGLAMPIDMIVDAGYSVYRTQQEGVLTVYPDTQGFVDLLDRIEFEGETTNEALSVYNVRVSDTEDGYKLRLTRNDAVIFLACTLGGSTLTCIDNDAPEPSLDTPEIDPRNYQFERTSTEI